MNEKLMMIVNLSDQATKPLRGIVSELDNATERGKRGFQNMAQGAAGLVATGYSITQALAPALEMSQALNHVRALGVMKGDLNVLEQAAYDFASTYGQSAVEFVNSSTLMKNALGEMSGDELVAVTRNASTLAAAMKTDTDTIARLMKTVHGNYQQEAEKMGMEAFTAEIAGMVGEAHLTFGVNVDELEGAIDGMHSLPSSLGVSFAEETTVLSVLMKSMSEGDAVTQYTNFLEGAADAQEKLGVQLVNSTGDLLPMAKVLEQIEPLIQGLSGIEARKLLDDAGLGDGSLMLMNLIDNADQFRNGLNRIDGSKGMDNVTNIAAASTNQFERLNATWFALRAAVFGAVVPALSWVAETLADVMRWVTELTDQFPVLTGIIGSLAVVAMSCAGVVASVSVVMGIAQMMAGGWAATIKVLNTVFKLNRIVMLASTAATWAFSAALWANPITWVIALVVGLIAAVGAMIYWWDDVKASFGDTAVFKFLADTIDWVIDKLNMIPGVDIDIDAQTGEMPTEIEQATTLDGMPSFAKMYAPTPAQPMPAGMVPMGVSYAPTEVSQAGNVVPMPVQPTPAQPMPAGMASMGTYAPTEVPQTGNVVPMPVQPTPAQPMPAGMAPMGVSYAPPEMPQTGNVVPMPVQPTPVQSMPAGMVAMGAYAPTEVPQSGNVVPIPDYPHWSDYESNRSSPVMNYKRPENTPALSTTMVQNLNRQQSQQVSNSVQYGDVYITSQEGMTPDQLNEWNELNAG